MVSCNINDQKTKKITEKVRKYEKYQTGYRI